MVNVAAFGQEIWAQILAGLLSQVQIENGVSQIIKRVWYPSKYCNPAMGDTLVVGDK